MGLRRRMGWSPVLCGMGEEGSGGGFFIECGAALPLFFVFH